MASPTQLCWRYHSLPLSQQCVKSQSYNNHTKPGEEVSCQVPIIFNIQNLSFKFLQELIRPSHEYLVLHIHRKFLGWHSLGHGVVDACYNTRVCGPEIRLVRVDNLAVYHKPSLGRNFKRERLFLCLTVMYLLINWLFNCFCDITSQCFTYSSHIHLCVILLHMFFSLFFLSHIHSMVHWYNIPSHSTCKVSQSIYNEPRIQGKII